jgi:hypothetical protein
MKKQLSFREWSLRWVPLSAYLRTSLCSHLALRFSHRFWYIYTLHCGFITRTAGEIWHRPYRKKPLHFSMCTEASPAAIRQRKPDCPHLILSEIFSTDYCTLSLPLGSARKLFLARLKHRNKQRFICVRRSRLAGGTILPLSRCMLQILQTHYRRLFSAITRVPRNKWVK